MIGDTATDVVARLARSGPPDAERLAALLGTTLRLTDENADWAFYTFELAVGPFAAGILRMSEAGDAALVSLSPRDPPGLTEGDLVATTWGPRRDAVAEPRLSAEGADRLTYRHDGVIMTVVWTHASRRLLNLTLEWPAPGASEAESAGDATA